MVHERLIANALLTIKNGDVRRARKVLPVVVHMARTESNSRQRSALTQVILDLRRLIDRGPQRKQRIVVGPRFSDAVWIHCPEGHVLKMGDVIVWGRTQDECMDLMFEYIDVHMQEQDAAHPQALVA